MKGEQAKEDELESLLPDESGAQLNDDLIAKLSDKDADKTHIESSTSVIGAMVSSSLPAASHLLALLLFFFAFCFGYLACQQSCLRSLIW